MWVYSPPKPPAPKVSASVKAEAQQQANQLVEAILKPQHLRPPPKDYHFNYIVDIYTNGIGITYISARSIALPARMPCRPILKRSLPDWSMWEEIASICPSRVTRASG